MKKSEKTNSVKSCKIYKNLKECIFPLGFSILHACKLSFLPSLFQKYGDVNILEDE